VTGKGTGSGQSSKSECVSFFTVGLVTPELDGDEALRFLLLSTKGWKFLAADMLGEMRRRHPDSRRIRAPPMLLVCANADTPFLDPTRRNSSTMTATEMPARTAKFYESQLRCELKRMTQIPLD